ncbi:MAG TPA: nuclear transport factor 2 family protein [Ktedonobacteraceae bacterium]|nr:nuclear transport factor 2 family protein [Ktedonobacteraceae bacterium]
MNAKEIVKTFITALQSGAIAMAARYMTDDFKLIGWTPEPLDRGKFLALQTQMDTGMPDFSYNLTDLHARGSVVTGLIQLAATHTRDLAFPQFGIPTILTTGQVIGLPQVPAEFALRDGKVAEMKMQTVPGGGMEGLLQQLDEHLSIPPRIEDINQPGNTEESREREVRARAPAYGPAAFPVNEFPE